MNGTLALWYDKRDQGTKVTREAQRVLGLEQNGEVHPELELHFNLWRDFTNSLETNFLDIGMRFRTPLEQVKQFYLYVPRPISIAQLSDLSDILKFGQTLDAVFNSVIEPGKQGDRHFKTSEFGRDFTTIHSVEFGPDSDVKVEEFRNDDGSTGTLIIFTEQLCERIRAQQAEDCVNSYIRFRLSLSGPSAELFSQEVTMGNYFDTSRVGQLELTEFRLNERRSFPIKIAKLSQNTQFNVRQIHYFLIRSLRHELKMQHKSFRKVRRLEGNLWLHYLLGDKLHGDKGAKKKKAYKDIADQMVIYHWRDDAKGDDSIDDFVAFASFRTGINRLWAFLVMAIFLGIFASWASSTLPDIPDIPFGKFIPFIESFEVVPSLEFRVPGWVSILVVLLISAGVIWKAWKAISGPTSFLQRLCSRACACLSKNRKSK
ncbi:hypothetical protein [Pelagimonas varians]|uniref:Uncharacterized protein n=1 Tax=Pelagimonas varians TaxID=696760 RepID=A0A238KCU8_9RHOB|nr:hypothetical protein [Pelagimonas varians]PYG29950.1 hypothetical protein C8N36_107116 [Pelagimonas varians]SMX40671.1 hypothetical protein PEV8663_02079 [Pelagimonas varians]